MLKKLSLCIYPAVALGDVGGAGAECFSCARHIGVRVVGTNHAAASDSYFFPCARPSPAEGCQ